MCSSPARFVGGWEVYRCYVSGFSSWFTSMRPPNCATLSDVRKVRYTLALIRTPQYANRKCSQAHRKHPETQLVGADVRESPWAAPPATSPTRPQYLVQSLRRLLPTGKQHNQDRPLAEDFLVANDLRKSFDGIQAVDGVSFTIRRQEIYGLLGPNGAGKTTTIRMLSTVASPDSGEVFIGGHSVRGRRRPGPQDHRRMPPRTWPLYPELSARDNLVFFGKMAGPQRPRSRRAVPASIWSW